MWTVDRNSQTAENVDQQVGACVKEHQFAQVNGQVIEHLVMIEELLAYRQTQHAQAGRGDDQDQRRH